jgi:hypothetical protein
MLLKSKSTFDSMSFATPKSVRIRKLNPSHRKQRILGEDNLESEINTKLQALDHFIKEQATQETEQAALAEEPTISFDIQEEVPEKKQKPRKGTSSFMTYDRDKYYQSIV